MKQKFLAIGLILSVVVMINNRSLQAGVTGKIRGKVIDKKSGESLPGANVFISKIWLKNQEADFRGGLGAATNERGEYVILKVPPGNYSVTVSIIGYSSLIQRHVIVNVDRTTIVDFSLQEEVLELGESIVVEAPQDVIQLDVSGTESYITDTEYQQTPFSNRIEDVIGLQSGVSGNIVEGDIKIRAGETREVGFLVDGMELVDKKFNRPIMSIQPGMVQEIKIMRNGFNAEYGQSRSGIINVVTKNPTDQYHLSLDYQFTPAHKPHFGRNKFDKDWRWEWRLMDGEKAFQGDTISIPDGLYEKQYFWMGWNKFSQFLNSDNNPDNDLTADEAYELWKWRHRPMAYGNINGHNVDLTLSGPVPGLPWKSNFLLGGKYEDHPFDYPQSIANYGEKIGSLKWVNILGPGIKLIIDGMYSQVTSVAKGNLNSGWREETLISYDGESFREYYPFSTPIINRRTRLFGAKFVHSVSPTLFYEFNLNHFFVDWGINRPKLSAAEQGRSFHDRLYYDPQAGFIPKDLGYDDIPSGYQMYGTALLWDNSWNRRTSFTGAFTDQFHPSHELKAGFSIHYDILNEDRILWQNEDPSREFIRKFKVQPIETGIYLQDKIEFEGMIANVGVRMDYFNPNSELPDIRRALEYESDRTIFEAVLNNTYPTYRPKARTYFSPRVGLSHPLSERSKIYFNYGHFVQTPPTRDLYTKTLDRTRPGMTMMGNPELPFEKTIAYELGSDIGISNSIQLHIGAFYKDNFDVSSRMTYAHSDQSLVLDWFGFNDYSEIRGLEIELRKSAGRFVTGWFNYNYIKKSSSNLSIPNLSDNPIVTDDPKIGINGVVWGVPLSDIVRVAPNARGVITFLAPKGWGPQLFGYRILSNTNFSIQAFYQGGRQLQHPRQSFRDAHPAVWFKELGKYWANIRISRRFSTNLVNFELYLDGSNIIHTRFRYPPGGRSGEDYFDDLWNSGRLNKVGTDKLTNPQILRSYNDDIYWGRVKSVVMGMRIDL